LRHHGDDDLDRRGLLAFALSTQDIRISSDWWARKRPFQRGGGIHRFTLIFDPASMNASAMSNVQWIREMTDLFIHDRASHPACLGTGALPLPGYSIGGGQQWGRSGSTTG